MVKVVLAFLHRSPVFHLLMFLSEALVHFLVLPAYLFAGSVGEVRADESKIRAVEFDELYDYWITSPNFSSSEWVQGPGTEEPGCEESRIL